MLPFESSLCVVRLKYSWHNMFCTLLTPCGTIWKTVASGYFRFKGTNKSTQAAAQKLAYFLEQSLIEGGFRECSILSQGYMIKTRHILFTEIKKKNIKINHFLEFPKRAHNGCRLPKARR